MAHVNLTYKRDTLSSVNFISATKKWTLRWITYTENNEKEKRRLSPGENWKTRRKKVTEIGGLDDPSCYLFFQLLFFQLPAISWAWPAALKLGRVSVICLVDESEFMLISQLLNKVVIQSRDDNNDNNNDDNNYMYMNYMYMFLRGRRGKRPKAAQNLSPDFTEERFLGLLL